MCLAVAAVVIAAAAVPAQVLVDPKDIDAAFDAALARAAGKHGLPSSSPRSSQSSQSPSSRGVANPLDAALLDRIPLDDAERAMFVKNGGVVVAPGLGGGGPAHVYDRIYTHDIPMFLTADAILFAWHETVDDIVAQTEVGIAPDVDAALANMLDAAPALRAQLSSSPMKQGVDDAVLYLQVAHALLQPPPLDGYDAAGNVVPPRGVDLGLDVGAAVDAAGAAALFDRVMRADGAAAVSVDIYGGKRDEDFSLFLPRGHYAKPAYAETLTPYFRAMMWLARMGPLVSGPASSDRQLAAAVAVHELAKISGTTPTWQRVSAFYDALAGATDFVTLTDVAAVRALAGPADFAAVNDAALTRMRTKLASTTIGKKRIDGTPRVVPFGSPQSRTKIETARRFALFSQRFAIDAWVLEKVTYNRVRDDNGEPIPRTMPDVRDVAYAVFADDAVAAGLNDLMARTKKPYAKNLLAARAVVDALPPSFFDATVDGLWVKALRSLAPSAKARALSPVFGTEAWKTKLTQTRLSSYAELRHDNVLAAEGGFGMDGGCSYPFAFVEPVPDAFRALSAAALKLRAASMHAWPAPLPSSPPSSPSSPPSPSPSPLAPPAPSSDNATDDAAAGDAAGDAAARDTSNDDANDEWRFGPPTPRDGIDKHLANFAKVMDRLAHIADDELRGNIARGDDEKWLDAFVHHDHTFSVGCGGRVAEAIPTRPIGWYFDLFPHFSDETYDTRPIDGQPIVSDVFTATNTGVLHAATGNFDVVVIVVPVQGKPTAFAGAASSFYTFEAGAGERLTDADWNALLYDDKAPPRPSWLTHDLVAEDKRSRVSTNGDGVVVDDNGRWPAHARLPNPEPVDPRDAKPSRKRTR